MSNTWIKNLAILALAAAASGAALAADPQCGPKPGVKASGDPIRLGAVVSQTGPSDFSAVSRGAAAYFACVNTNGGVHGRPIEYTSLDDQWTPEISRQQANSLINDKKVLALVGGFSLVSCAAQGELLQKSGVVSIGLNAQRECFNNGNILSVTGGPRRGMVALAQYAKAQFGAKTVAVSLLQVPGADWVMSGTQEWGKANGVQIVPVPFDPQTADPTSFALQIGRTKADAYILGLPKDLSIAVLKAAEQQDLAKSMRFLGLTAIYSPEVPNVLGPYWANRFHVALEVGPLDAANADTDQWKQVMAKFGNAADARDTFSQGGYLAAKIVTTALSKMDPAKVSRPQLSAALLNTANLRDQMMCSPFTVRSPSAAGHMDVRDLWISVNTGSAWKVAQECRPALFVGEQ